MVADSAPRARPLDPRGFYKEALQAAEREQLPLALQVAGVDEEIALLRVLLRSALEQRPDDLQLMFRGIDLLTRAVATRYRLSRGAADELGDGLKAATQELGQWWRHLAQERAAGQASTEQGGKDDD